MCGIAGYFSKNKFTSADLLKMTDAISHRGPDAKGVFSDDICGLGHRRLSIIDLSETANQPMYSANEQFIIVYNGEVYNYSEIALELKTTYDFQPKTTSDTEIVLEAYARWGAKSIEKLNGMFAFAIYNKTNKELFICRDRIGIKPLHYYWDGINLAFASELKSLKKISSINYEVNQPAITLFLHLGFIPAPHSIYKNIYKLEAGKYIKIKDEKLETNEYWNINQQIKKDIITDEKEASQQLDLLIENSVKIQLRSDVPFGVFLSGGIDSSLVTAKAVKLSNSKINTFSIGFEENKYNESIYAKAVANHLNTNHHEFIVTYKNAIELIESISEIYDEPFADSSCIPTMLVSKLARQHVTVTLSGEGGDELFHGYGAYKWAKRLNHPLVKTMRKPLALALANSASRYKRHSKHLNYPSKELIYSHILSQEQNCFTTKELKIFLKNNDIEKSLIQLYQYAESIEATKRKLNASEKQAIFDLHFYLQDDLLTKVDRASMHYSLETRVPYLDHRIIEFAINLSPELKIKNSTSKYLLKKLLYEHVPEKLFNRPKQGFAIPLEKWLKNELRYLIDEYLSAQTINKYQVVNYDVVDKLKKDFFSGNSYLYNRIWLLIILHKWLKENSFCK